MEYLNEDVRRRLVRQANRRGETPLHHAVRAKGFDWQEGKVGGRSGSTRTILNAMDVFEVERRAFGADSEGDGDGDGNGDGEEDDLAGATNGDFSPLPTQDLTAAARQHGVRLSSKLCVVMVQVRRAPLPSFVVVPPAVLGLDDDGRRSSAGASEAERRSSDNAVGRGRCSIHTPDPESHHLYFHAIHILYTFITILSCAEYNVFQQYSDFVPIISIPFLFLCYSYCSCYNAHDVDVINRGNFESELQCFQL